MRILARLGAALSIAGPAPKRAPPWPAVLLLLACGSDGPAGPSATDLPFDGELILAHAPERVFTHVHVVDPETGAVALDREVRIRGGRILEVRAAGGSPSTGTADVVDGDGKWLMPALVDMHVHMRAADAEAYIRSGITTVRNMWGFSGLRSIQERIADGTLVGPTIYSLSPGLDGPPVQWPETQLITDPAGADSLVALQYARGYRELKVYQSLSAPVYDAIVAAAAVRGMTLAGHKPTQVPLRRVIESGQRSIEHLGGYLLAGGPLDEAIALTVEHGTWNCPTLEIQSRLSGASASTALRAEVTKALFGAGARLLVGTDSGIDVTEPGLSLAEEIEELRSAGIPLPAVLRMATVGAAEYLGLGGRIGRVAPGYDADLVLLAANPLEDLNALRRPLGVHRGDAWIDMR